eukprot:GHVN01098471.1.p1 GENE.GHVN01098471.1~~GHVN01098471.1.p1  ORF type:complete len:350 (-),score=30.93 GHVN01098471.1:41-1090(-)
MATINAQRPLEFGGWHTHGIPRNEFLPEHPPPTPHRRSLHLSSPKSASHRGSTCNVFKASHLSQQHLHQFAAMPVAAFEAERRFATHTSDAQTTHPSHAHTTHPSHTHTPLPQYFTHSPHCITYPPAYMTKEITPAGCCTIADGNSSDALKQFSTAVYHPQNFMAQSPSQISPGTSNVSPPFFSQNIRERSHHSHTRRSRDAQSKASLKDELPLEQLVQLLAKKLSKERQLTSSTSSRSGSPSQTRRVRFPQQHSPRYPHWPSWAIPELDDPVNNELLAPETPVVCMVPGGFDSSCNPYATQIVFNGARSAASRRPTQSRQRIRHQAVGRHTEEPFISMGYERHERKSS